MPASNDFSTRNRSASDTTTDSCLVTKLGHYMALTDTERDLLATLEKSEQPVCAGEEIFSGGDANKNLFVVKHGWFYTYTHLPDGGRLLVRVYHAGDVIGMPMLAFDRHTVNMRAVTAGCLCPFAKARMDLLLTGSPRLSALLFTIAAREETILVDTLRATNRMRPESRIAYLLLSLLARLKITNSRMTNRFRLPLNQSEIGDALGLTNVTVSRTLSIMEEKRLIARSDGDIVLVEIDQLKQQCDFQDRHAEMDTSWFPSG